MYNKTQKVQNYLSKKFQKWKYFNHDNIATLTITTKNLKVSEK